MDTNWIECKDRFLASLQNEATRNYYAGTLQRWLAFSGDPEAVTYSLVDDFIHQRCAPGCRNFGRPARAGTVACRLAILKSWYKFASHFRVPGPAGPVRLFQGENPTDVFKAPKPARVNKCMTEDEIKLFFHTIAQDVDTHPSMKARDMALFSFLLMSARRVSEVCSMTIRDIESTIIEGREAYMYHFRPRKKRVLEDDTQELSPIVKSYIDEMLKHREFTFPDMPLFAAIGARGGAGFIHDPYTGIGPVAVHARMRVYLRKAGMDSSGRISPHSFRHTSATMRLKQGSTIVEISRLLRHERLDTTVLYLQGSITPADAGLARMEQALANVF